MATPRHLLVDPVNECDYHLVSRCVRRAFLCGVDEHDGRDYSHRRAWLVQRLGRIAPCFAVDVYIEEVRDTSIRERLQVNSAEALADYLRPVVSGLDGWSAAAESPPRAVVAVEARVEGQTVTFDLRASRPGARPRANRRRPRRTIPALSKPKRPKRNPPRSHPAPNRARRRRSPRGRAGGPCGRGEPVAGPDDGAPQAAARLRGRAGAAAMARRPDHAVPGDAPARLRPGRRPGGAPWSPRAEPLGQPSA